MSQTARKLLEEASRLKPEDRALVAAELSEESDGTPSEVRRAWIEEAVVRLEAHREADEDDTASLDEVERFLLSSIRQTR